MSSAVAKLPFPGDPEQDIKHRVLSGNFVVTLQQSNQRTNSLKSLQFTGPIYVDDTPEEVNARVDLYQSVVNRQTVLEDIKFKQESIAGILANLELLAKQNDDLKAKRASGAKLPSTQKQQFENYDGQVKNQLDMVAKLQSEIKALQKTIGIE